MWERVKTNSVKLILKWAVIPFTHTTILFKKLSAAEVSESVYMRERVIQLNNTYINSLFVFYITLSHIQTLSDTSATDNF